MPLTTLQKGGASVSVIDTLVTDRTQADRIYLESLLAKGWEGMTEEERRYFAGESEVPLEDSEGFSLYSSDGLMLWATDSMAVVKGAYNASDLNRVTNAVEYLAARLRGYGNKLDLLSGNGIWSMNDIPDRDSMRRYLGDVERIRSSISVLPGTPFVPDDMEDLTVDEANAIEKILVDVEFLLNNMESAWLYSGDIYSGEVI